MMQHFSQLPRIGRYQVEAEVGRGGFATVYRARDVTLERVVALKLLHPYWVEDPHFVARFQREARAAARLQHPHIVTIYDSGEVEGQFFIAMAYVKGFTLQDLLNQQQRLTLPNAIPILTQIAAALDYAHAQGVIHRDVKPGNIMLTLAEQGLRVTLVDFGLVKALEGSAALTTAGTMLGTLAYMAPEQATPRPAAPIGPAADRYALGIVAYHMLTGRVPFPGNTPATLHAHVSAPVPSPRALRPELPDAAAAALLRMLAKTPEARFASAAEFVAQLQADSGATADATAVQGRHDGARRHSAAPRLVLSAATGDTVPEVALPWTKLLAAAWPRPSRPLPSRFFRQIFAMAVLFCLLLGVGLLWLKERRGGDMQVVTTAVPQPEMLPLTAGATPSATINKLPQPALGARWQRADDGQMMVGVPAGRFAMGNENYGADEQPVHTVKMDAFLIDATEITNAQFAAFLSANGNRYEGGASWLDTGRDYVRISRLGDVFQADPDYANHPVVGVSWHGARAYCDWVGAALPTEAQWEYAARGQDGRFYPWGSATADCTRANYWSQAAGCAGGTAAVGSYPAGASWVGALDLAGNVWEWVADWHRADYYRYAPEINPQGPATGSDKVMRGGAWSYHAASLRAALREHQNPAFRSLNVGFRCALTPER